MNWLDEGYSPRARTPDPTSAPALRWGMLGTGWIAERFVTAIQRHTRQEFVGVASRDLGRARQFATVHGIARAYGAYADLVSDASIDVVYVATPIRLTCPVR